MSEAQEFNKITVGFVTQRYVRGKDGVARCVDQTFTAGETTYETDEEVIPEQGEEYCKYEMKQPYEEGMGGCGDPWHTGAGKDATCPTCHGTFVIVPNTE